MAEFSKISWTDATFNPWWICTNVGPGCDNCYAERDARRYGYGWGQGTPRRFFGDKHWNDPLRWNEKAKREGKKKKVFCASMADWADNEVGQEHRDRLFALIKKTDWLIWQLLTKRVGNAKKMLPADWGDGYENVWFGITVVNQEEAERDIPKLLDIPAHLRWLSVEPCLSYMNLLNYLYDQRRTGVPGTNSSRLVFDGYRGTNLETCAIPGGRSTHNSLYNPASQGREKSIGEGRLSPNYVSRWQAQESRSTPNRLDAIESQTDLFSYGDESQKRKETRQQTGKPRTCNTQRKYKTRNPYSGEKTESSIWGIESTSEDNCRSGNRDPHSMEIWDNYATRDRRAIRDQAIDNTKYRQSSQLEAPTVNWVIIGGESGPLEKVRPLHINWVRNGIGQCREAGVAVFIKQMGARTFMDPEDGVPLLRTFSHADAADPEKWPRDIRIQEFPAWT